MFSLHEKSLRLTYLSSQLFYQLPNSARSERSISHAAVQPQSLISGSRLGATAATCNVKKVANFYTAGNLSLKSYSTSSMSSKYPMLEKVINRLLRMLNMFSFISKLFNVGSIATRFICNL